MRDTILIFFLVFISNSQVKSQVSLGVGGKFGNDGINAFFETGLKDNCAFRIGMNKYAGLSIGYSGGVYYQRSFVKGSKWLIGGGIDAIRKTRSTCVYVMDRKAYTFDTSSGRIIIPQ
jgi:hypothetical protein